VHEGAIRLAQGTIVADASQAPLPNLLARLRVEDHERAYACQTVWWTVGGEEYHPRAVVERRLPDPYLFTGMLTGSFDNLHGS
jgi:type VI secretion system protein ImpM